MAPMPPAAHPPAYVWPWDSCHGHPNACSLWGPWAVVFGPLLFFYFLASRLFLPSLWPRF